MTLEVTIMLGVKTEQLVCLFGSCMRHHGISKVIVLLKEYFDIVKGTRWLDGRALFPRQQKQDFVESDPFVPEHLRRVSTRQYLSSRAPLDARKHLWEVTYDF